MKKINRESPDPFETAFFDYLDGVAHDPIIVHNNKGDDEIMPVEYFFRKFDGMPLLEQMALRACTGSVLDVGAGSGCHSLYLQEKGFDVTALDIRPGFVEVMNRQGIQQTICANILEFNQGKYDTLLMLMNGIGFTQSFSGLKIFLNIAKEILLPGGQIILDSTDLLYLYQQEDGSIVLDLNEEYYGEVEYKVEYKNTQGTPFKWLFIDFTNLTSMAEELGFNSELIHEDENHRYLARLY